MLNPDQSPAEETSRSGLIDPSHYCFEIAGTAQGGLGTKAGSLLDDDVYPHPAEFVDAQLKLLEENDVVTQTLPSQFAALDPFLAKWDLPGTRERYEARLASTIDELREFHGAMKPHITAIRDYLDTKPMSEFTGGERSLGRLAFAWATVAEAVEVFKQPRVPDSKGYWDVREEVDL